jgi:hypothetical protein
MKNFLKGFFVQVVFFVLISIMVTLLYFASGVWNLSVNTQPTLATHGLLFIGLFVPIGPASLLYFVLTGRFVTALAVFIGGLLFISLIGRYLFQNAVSNTKTIIFQLLYNLLGLLFITLIMDLIFFGSWISWLQFIRGTPLPWS